MGGQRSPAKSTFRVSKGALSEEEHLISFDEVIIITLTLALTWPLNAVSATCWGSSVWHMLLWRTADQVSWKHTLITSTSDFSESYTSTLATLFHQVVESAIKLGYTSQLIDLSLCKEDFFLIFNTTFLIHFLKVWHVTSITLIWALTWPLNAVSASCWGSFADFSRLEDSRINNCCWQKHQDHLE